MIKISERLIDMEDQANENLQASSVTPIVVLLVAWANETKKKDEEILRK